MQFRLIYGFIRRVCGIRIYNLYFAVMHTKEENNCLKKGKKTHKIQEDGMFTWKFKMAAIFVKLYTSLPIHRCIDLSNPSKIERCDFFKDICNSRVECTPPPPTNSNGDTSVPLPNRSRRYQEATPTTWLNFYTPCKSQLKNAWPVSPTNRPVKRGFAV